MEKLFELLQIYIIERQGREQFKLHGDKIILWRPYKLRRFPQYDTNAVIISKRFGFIQWLVENDKIDIDKLKFQSDFMFPLWKDFDQLGSEDIEEYSEYESLLMLLSISSSPIEDLISYLR